MTSFSVPHLVKVKNEGRIHLLILTSTNHCTFLILNFSNQPEPFFLALNATNMLQSYLNCFALLCACVFHYLSDHRSYCFSMSGRDIRDVCLQAERSWASKVRIVLIFQLPVCFGILFKNMDGQIIRGQVSKDSEQANLPPLQEYIVCATNRQEALLSAAADRKSRSSPRHRIIGD